MFGYTSLSKNENPGMGHFWPQGHTLNKLGRGLLYCATYQISRLYALWFQTRRFYINFLYTLCVKYAVISLDCTLGQIQNGGGGIGGMVGASFKSR